MKTVDVLIAGAGPAGVTCATLLQRAGHPCLLVDPASFPRDKICGGGLTPSSWQLLDRLFPGLQYEYLPVREMSLYIERKYRGTYALDREMRVVVRKDFDNVLLNEYLKAGGEFLQERVWDIHESEDGTIVVTMQSGLQVRCRYLVGADGANSRVRRYLAPDAKADTFIVEQYLPRSGQDRIIGELSRSYDNGYFYIFPNKKFEATGYVEKHTDVRKLSAIIRDFGLEESANKGAFIPTEINYPSHERILLVGDAGCWCDRATYEGIHHAIATGRNAAQAILEGCPFAEVNKDVMRRKRHRNKTSRILYSRFGLAALKLISCSPRLTARILNRHL